MFLFNFILSLLNIMKTTINIIGSGFSSLAASCYLAQAGYDVTIFEKNNTIGGRARQLKKELFIIIG